MIEKGSIGRARNLRRTATDAETLLWQRLRNRQLEGVKFRRQVAVDRFIADFLAAEARLIVELDGGQHLDSIADMKRTATLQSCGYQVTRFWNHDVIDNIDGVLDTIARELAR